MGAIVIWTRYDEGGTESAEVATSVYFVSHSNGMTSFQSSSTENVSCNVALLFYNHSVVIQHIVSDRRLSLISKENGHNVR